MMDIQSKFVHIIYLKNQIIFENIFLFHNNKICHKKKLDKASKIPDTLNFLMPSSANSCRLSMLMVLASDRYFIFNGEAAFKYKINYSTAKSMYRKHKVDFRNRKSLMRFYDAINSNRGKPKLSRCSYIYQEENPK